MRLNYVERKKGEKMYTISIVKGGKRMTKRFDFYRIAVQFFNSGEEKVRWGITPLMTVQRYLAEQEERKFRAEVPADLVESSRGLYRNMTEEYLRHPCYWRFSSADVREGVCGLEKCHRVIEEDLFDDPEKVFDSLFGENPNFLDDGWIHHSFAVHPGGKKISGQNIRMAWNTWMKDKKIYPSPDNWKNIDPFLGSIFLQIIR